MVQTTILAQKPIQLFRYICSETIDVIERIILNGKGWIDRDWERILPQVVKNSGLDHRETLDIPYLEKEEIDGKFLVFEA